MNKNCYCSVEDGIMCEYCKEEINNIGLLEEKLEVINDEIDDYEKWYCLCIDLSEIFLSQKEMHLERANVALETITKLKQERKQVLEELKILCA